MLWNIYVFSKGTLYAHRPNLLPRFQLLRDVLANWCQMFGEHFNVNQPLVNGWDFELIAKIYNHIVGVHVFFKICPRSQWIYLQWFWMNLIQGFPPILWWAIM
jgi:hypothetical protein